ncbi:MAG: rhomboid family intramembrane serine protease [Deltaproteobacteria bacterium]|nr:rhomboid family intramembrane serine protease [Deltaproteobacteria bacterium]
MIPIRDTTPSKNYPVVNTAIIGLNVLVYLFQLSRGSGLDRFIYTYGLVPARYTVPEIGAYFTTGQQALALISFMFLHGGFFHLLGNMWSLYIFGDNVEDRLGPVRYLIFYLLAGIFSGLVHMLSDTHSMVPTIGASGAIAGVMGAYFIMHPNSKILTLIPIIFIPWFVEIPAFIFIGFWFVLQILNAAGGGGQIAWWAHIGGFIFGILFLKLALRMPATGISAPIKRVTTKKKSHRLQVIHPAGPADDADLYGSLNITPTEAFQGSYKLVNIPWGFHKRMVRVTVPAGVTAGKTLKLKGLGKQMPDGSKGDLYLKIRIAQ